MSASGAEFDVVVCVGPFDNDIVNSSVSYTKKNIIGHRNIYLICSDPTIVVDGTITIDERIFPFTIDDVAAIHGKLCRNGWYLQQLLKLYAGKVIPGLSKKYLVIDSDTHFMKPTKFVTEDGKYIFTTGTEYHVPYFEHMNKLYPSLKKIHSLSGISHHTFFDTEIVNELITMVENYHNGSSFWKLFLEYVVDNLRGRDLSGASEYELYFTYMILNHPDKIFIRQLSWINTGSLNLNTNHDFISVHHYLR